MYFRFTVLTPGWQLVFDLCVHIVDTLRIIRSKVAEERPLRMHHVAGPNSSGGWGISHLRALVGHRWPVRQKTPARYVQRRGRWDDLKLWALGYKQVSCIWAVLRLA